jgi:hypothetical protein
VIQVTQLTAGLLARRGTLVRYADRDATAKMPEGVFASDHAAVVSTFGITVPGAR